MNILPLCFINSSLTPDVPVAFGLVTADADVNPIKAFGTNVDWPVGSKSLFTDHLPVLSVIPNKLPSFPAFESSITIPPAPLPALEPEFNTIYLSLTSNVSSFWNEAVPCTIKSPGIVTSDVASAPIWIFPVAGSVIKEF